MRARGWIKDASGRRSEGGGTYRFWIGRRMTLATATFHGQPYPVGARYGRDIQFNPAVPADVTVSLRLYAGSDPRDVRQASYSGKATPAGLFGTACQDCHTTGGWLPARLTLHTFPLDHGEQGEIPCATCHTASYPAYTCFGCHDHQPDQMRQEHAEVDLSRQPLDFER